MPRPFTVLWKALVSAPLLRDSWPQRCKGHRLSSSLVSWIITWRISRCCLGWVFRSLLKMFLFCFSGSDKEAILDLVTSRSNAQRQEIIAAYKSNFGQVNKYIFKCYSCGQKFTWHSSVNFNDLMIYFNHYFFPGCNKCRVYIFNGFKIRIRCTILNLFWSVFNPCRVKCILLTNI